MMKKLQKDKIKMTKKKNEIKMKAVDEPVLK